LNQLDNGGWDREEFVGFLGVILKEEHSDSLFDHFPLERHPILRDGYAEALQRVADEDCLEPPRSIFGTAPANTLWQLELAERLLDARTEPLPIPALRVVCVPSFSPPWAVRAFEPLHGQSDAVRRVVYTTTRGAESEVVRHECRIDEKLLQRLVALWDRMVSSSRVPKKPRGGADGVVWHFTNRMHGGQVWSPERRSLPWRLAGVAELLAKLALSEPGQQPAILAELDTELTAFGI
jgi:hypothetical protein